LCLPKGIGITKHQKGFRGFAGSVQSIQPFIFSLHIINSYTIGKKYPAIID
jgi:hypothetical protein